MAVLDVDLERYAHPAALAREVNLPLLGTAAVAPVPPGAPLSVLLEASLPAESHVRGALDAIVEGLAQTRQSLTLRSLLLAGFPHDPECFALGLAIGRAWSRMGLKVAVVDLDGWNPTVVRPVGEPPEGFVDILEYGCSFPRAAWEVVAGSLWLVGAGVHPPDEERLTEHPDWGRVTRLFAAHADVTLYVAPFLHRPGLTGRLSKRMDAAVLAASVERVGRAELRDAFLELWGSDAPIIGCVGLEPAGAVEHDPFEPILIPGRTPSPPPPAPSTQSASGPGGGESAADPPASPGLASAPPPARVPEEPVGAAPAPAPPEAAAALRDDETENRALLAALEAEVRAGTITRRLRRGPSKRVIWLGAAGGLVLGALVAAWALFLDRGAGPLPSADLLPAGEERVLPAPEAVAGDQGEAPGGTAAPGNGERPVAAALDGRPSGALPLTAGPPAAGMPFTVHVASFRSQAKVAPIVRQLRLLGADAWFEQASDAPGWYRVFVGRFATEAEASTYAAWLLEQKWVDRATAHSTAAR